MSLCLATFLIVRVELYLIADFTKKIYFIYINYTINDAFSQCFADDYRIFDVCSLKYDVNGSQSSRTCMRLALTSAFQMLMAPTMCLYKQFKIHDIKRIRLFAQQKL